MFLDPEQVRIRTGNKALINQQNNQNNYSLNLPRFGKILAGKQ